MTDELRRPLGFVFLGAVMFIVGALMGSVSVFTPTAGATISSGVFLIGALLVAAGIVLGLFGALVLAIRLIRSGPR